jgi:hypothetical protein
VHGFLENIGKNGIASDRIHVSSAQLENGKYLKGSNSHFHQEHMGVMASSTGKICSQILRLTWTGYELPSHFFLHFHSPDS